ncbi:MAG: adenylyl-sulfate kinase [Limisphaerales bacterium]|nr:adenylyl-sulfate kinase [Verrucomicrobiae bacterium]HAR00671.1 adenylyl-sulfate kinase [Verrucomicrobiales bacterium]HBP56983.1 adenylyl-sulfate kinase [Verrucomicrobiales bacterium]HCZ03585.1 adenylyl-sulfate kinase [Verrucomicrobiales bacterium]|tara:strand:- start:811 stop:1416 length:606 start_codon:yes stop_codon:yes gene_type:complete
MSAENIHPIFNRSLDRSSKETLLGQKGIVIWLYGLSGAGKSTLAIALEEKLHTDGIMTQLLDGDNIRTGLNRNLGFTDADRKENIRRIAEVAKLFANAGIVTIASFITPKKELRTLAREVIREPDFREVFVTCSLETCEQRDVKGLYAKAKSGDIKNFTGKDSSFEPPEKSSPADLELNTDEKSEHICLEELYNFAKNVLK